MNEKQALSLIFFGLIVGLVSYGLPTIKAFDLFPKEEITFTQVNATIVEIPRHVDYWEDKLILEDKLQQVYNIAYMNAQEHEFKLHEYDCTQFSKNLVKKLNNLGYKAQCTAGNNWGSEYTNHTWTSVWIDGERYDIESTSGEFIPDYYFEEGFYTKWKEDYCW